MQKRLIKLCTIIIFNFCVYGKIIASETNIYSKFIISYLALKRYEIDHVDQFDNKPKEDYINNYIFLTKLISGGVKEVTDFYSLSEIKSMQNNSFLSGNMICLLYHIKNGQLVEAEKIMDEANTENSDLENVIIPFLRSWILVNKMKFNEAIENLSSMVEENTYDPFVSLQLAQIYEKMGDLEKADFHYSIVLHKENSFVSELSMLIASKFYLNQKNITKAKEIYNSIEENKYTYDQWVNLSKEIDDKTFEGRLSFILLEVADMLHNMNYNYSYIIYNNAAKYISPEIDYVNFKLARFFQTLDKHESAIKLFKSIDQDSYLSEIARLELRKYN